MQKTWNSKSTSEPNRSYLGRDISDFVDFLCRLKAENRRFSHISFLPSFLLSFQTVQKSTKTKMSMRRYNRFCSGGDFWVSVFLHFSKKHKPQPRNTTNHFLKTWPSGMHVSDLIIIDENDCVFMKLFGNPKSRANY